LTSIPPPANFADQSKAFRTLPNIRDIASKNKPSIHSEAKAMGLFDFLKRKNDPPQDEGPSPHYVFAHYALRQLALSSPLNFLAMMASPDANGFLDSILDQVAERCGQRPAFDHSAIKIHPLRVKQFPCAILELPEPKEIAEAFMVALVVPFDASSSEPPDADALTGRFFTLEKGETLDGQPRTVFAEWDEEGHSNYGDGPVVDVEAFCEAISSRV
jgi:hypothetical protein